ncbi:Uncharacterized protein FWK35_00012891 [Aphis craccivora]|uniref:Uncharacterized protein n=1 Tax=Aphis craccivora TaxID=307492 RepID=A0A6G0YPJ7_APHCR|nr:Uncharacterized protein FWK35_00012891 [Aphis craccivora]
MTSLKTRRKYLNLNFLFKLINNEIDFTLLLEKINFKINPKNTRDNNLFFIKSKHSNYSINFPANMLMSLGNSTNNVTRNLYIIMYYYYYYYYSYYL